MTTNETADRIEEIKTRWAKIADGQLLSVLSASWADVGCLLDEIERLEQRVADAGKTNTTSCPGFPDN